MDQVDNQIVEVRTSRIRLDENNRCIECDCVYLETDKVIEIQYNELPKPYDEFTRCLNDYKYINNEFIYDPIKQEPTFEQKILSEQERQGKH